MLNQPLSIALNNYVEEERASGRWSSITTYDNWKYTVKLVSQYFGRKKLKTLRKKICAISLEIMLRRIKQL